jgi:hypothetical protein
MKSTKLWQSYYLYPLYIPIPPKKKRYVAKYTPSPKRSCGPKIIRDKKLSQTFDKISLPIQKLWIYTHSPLSLSVSLLSPQKKYKWQGDKIQLIGSALTKMSQSIWSAVKIKRDGTVQSWDGSIPLEPIGGQIETGKLCQIRFPIHSGKDPGSVREVNVDGMALLVIVSWPVKLLVSK